MKYITDGVRARCDVVVGITTGGAIGMSAGVGGTVQLGEQIVLAGTPDIQSAHVRRLQNSGGGPPETRPEFQKKDF